MPQSMGSQRSDMTERLNNNLITKRNLGMNVSILSVLGQSFFHQLLRKSEQLVKAMVSPVVMYGCESWTVKKAER